jgi:threonine aldolase
MEDGLYLKIAAHADKMADKLRDTLAELGYPMLVDGVTNQVFPILPDTLLENLCKEFSFTEQQRVDETHRAVRFCTSWATTQENMDALCQTLRNFSK